MFCTVPVIFKSPEIAFPAVLIVMPFSQRAGAGLVVSGMMWPCHIAKRSGKAQSPLHCLQRHSVHRVAGVFEAEVCEALLLNLTGICISLEMRFNSKFLLLFRETLTFSEGWLLLLKPGVSAKTTAELCFRTSATSSHALCL